MWPKRGAQPLTVHPFAIESIIRTASSPMNAAASAAWPTNNRAIYVPFVLEKPIVVVKLWSYNGTAVTGNRDIGIYDARGRRLVSSGSVAGSGTNVIQEYDVTDTLIGPGLFYLALAASSTSAAFFRYNLNSVTQQLVGIMTQTTALPLPATFTGAAWTTGYVPVMGLSTRALI